jgi:cell division protein FtsL
MINLVTNLFNWLIDKSIYFIYEHGLGTLLGIILAIVFFLIAVDVVNYAEEGRRARYEEEKKEREKDRLSK